MTDRGTHSIECAKADGGDCHCDCHGTMHGIMRIPGRERAAKLGAKHGVGVKIAPVEGAGGKVTHYKVTDRETGLPPGGGTPAERKAARAAEVTVTATTKRTATLPPPVANWARKVRESLPQDAAGWDALYPRQQSMQDYARTRLAESEAYLAKLEGERQELVDRITASMKESGLTTRQINKELKSGRYLDINRIDDALEYARNQVEHYTKEIGTANADRPIKWAYDKSRTYKMPPAELEKHLARVLDVGQQAIDAIHDEFRRDPDHKRMREELQLRRSAKRELDMLLGPKGDKLPADEQNKRIAAVWDRLPENGNSTPKLERDIRRRESEIIREMLGSHRPFGGVRHQVKPAMTDEDARKSTGYVDDDSKVTAAREDWRDRLDEGSAYYPADWLRKSAANPLGAVTSSRAFYSSSNNVIALSRTDRDKAHYDGAYADETAEVTVHELGHRMEQYIPGLTHLEFAFVRKRSTMPDGTLEKFRTLRDITGYSGYRENEAAFEDQWKQAYAGKTYEYSRLNPGDAHWEAFQVGTQDLFGRSSDKFGDDELQAFVIGALLTLG